MGNERVTPKSIMFSVLGVAFEELQSSLAAPFHPIEIVEVLDNQGALPVLTSQNVSQNGFGMAGKIRHLKVRDGRYSARLVVPRELRPIIGKAELEIQLGADRRQALDHELREHEPRYANMEVDDLLVADLRAGIAGRLDDDELDDLVGYRIERFRERGNTDAAVPKLRSHEVLECASILA